MSRFPLTLACILCASPALAIGELPTVNPVRTVSAMDLYGVPPINQPVKIEKIERAAMKKTAGELLVPNRPAGDLWSNNGEAPLRMPDKSEYLTLKSDFALPEETLDLAAVSRGARSMGSKLRANPSQNNVRPQKNAATVASENRRDTAPEPMDKSGPASIHSDANNIPNSIPSGEAVPVPKERATPSSIKSAPRFQPVRKAPIRNSADADSARVADLDEEFAYKGDVPLSKLSPSQLKKAFKKTFVSENKHLSTYQIEDPFDEVSASEAQVGFDSGRDLSEQGGVRPLEIKISFNGEDSSLSRDNYNLLTEYAGIVSSNPKRAVQVSISERATRSYDGRKLAARRLAIIEQVLKDSGIIDKRVIPVLSQRSDDAFVLRVISSDTFQTLSEKKRDMFGDTTSDKTYKSMSW